MPLPGAPAPQSSSCSTASRRFVARSALLLSEGVFAASVGLLVYWLLYAGTQPYRNDAFHQQSKSHGLSPFYGCKGALLSPACVNQQVLYNQLLMLWLPSATLALSAVLVGILKPLATTANGSSHHSHSHTIISRLGMWMSRMIPPKSFWQWSCDGGLTFGDILVVLFWAAMNASWLSAIVLRSQARLIARAAAFGLAAPTASMKAKMVARAFGSLLAPNLVLLFYPVSRGSVVLQVLRVTYPAAVRYHRWLGHAVMTFVLLHGGMYWCSFWYDGTWVYGALSQDTDINNLYGSIAFVFGLGLWIAASDYIRRAHYSWFKALHHVGFWGFLVLGAAHNWVLVWYCLPGLMLYAVDAVFRVHQFAFEGSSNSSDGTVSSSSTSCSSSTLTTSSSSPPSPLAAPAPAIITRGVEVLHADVALDGTMCSLVLAAPRFAAAASGFVWLCVPEISWLAYHPFTFVAVPWPSQPAAVAPTAGKQGGTASAASTAAAAVGCTKTCLLVHIKAYNKWTKKLVQLVASKGTSICLKLQGPYSETPGPDTGCYIPAVAPSTTSTCGVRALADDTDAIIIAAGGNGVTEAFSVFQEVAAAGLGAAAGLPMLLIWCCRSVAELEFLAPRVLGMARTLGLHLTVKLFCTGDLSCVLRGHSDGTTSSKQLVRVESPPQPDKVVTPSASATVVAAPSNLSDMDAARAPATPDKTHETMPSNPQTTITVTAGFPDTPPASTSGQSAAPAAVCSAPGSFGSFGSVEPDHLQQLNVSSMCPVLALGSFSAASWFKMLLVTVTVTGAFAAIIITRQVGIVMPPHDPWPTSVLGPAFVALAAALMMLPGLLVLWSGISRVEAAPAAATTADTATVLGPAAAAAVGPVTALSAIVQGGIIGSLSHAESSQQDRSGNVQKPGAALQLQFRLPVCPVSSGSSMAVCSDVQQVPVASGRPQLQQLVGSWLATVEQLPVGAGDAWKDDSNISSNKGVKQHGHPDAEAYKDTCATVGSVTGAAVSILAGGSTNIHSSKGDDAARRLQRCKVFAMGPPKLVMDVQLLCDDRNQKVFNSSCGGIGGVKKGRQLWMLEFVRKTHQF